MVLYRKYRPQTISELDSQEVRERLSSALSSSYKPHAFLFTGPKGTGKTSAARIVAKVLNCESRIKNQELRIKEQDKSKKPTTHNPQPTTDIEPCNTCETCKSITEGRHLDIIEIDAASNRGIEEIRDLRDKIKLAPISARMKVYIVDEVHMLTTEAFNALLKTLEEPPVHAMFILATTEFERLPQTIVSRCIVLGFKKASDEEIIHCLKRVAKGEKFQFDDKFLSIIAASSDGSFRDATKYLEQAVAQKVKNYQQLSGLLGTDSQISEQMLMLLSTKEIKKILEEIELTSKKGTNAKFLTEDILRILHDILLSQHKIDEGKVSRKLTILFSQKEILALIKLFSRVYVELKSASIAFLPLEVAVVEWCDSNIKN